MYWGPIFLLHNPLRATILGKKCWEFCTTLPTERLSHGYGYFVGIRNDPAGLQHFWGKKGGVYKLKLEVATSTFLNIFVQDWTLCTVSVKIVGTLYCLLALPMLVCKIWWVNCDKQHWEGKEAGQKKTNNAGWKCPNYFCQSDTITSSLDLMHLGHTFLSFVG